MIDLIVPDLGEGIEKVAVTCWHCAVGDTVREGDDCVELAADKATFNVPATATGIIQEIIVPEGREVPVKAVLARIA